MPPVQVGECSCTSSCFSVLTQLVFSPRPPPWTRDWPSSNSRGTAPVPSVHSHYGVVLDLCQLLKYVNSIPVCSSSFPVRPTEPALRVTMHLPHPLLPIFSCHLLPLQAHSKLCRRSKTASSPLSRGSDLSFSVLLQLTKTSRDGHPSPQGDVQNVHFASSIKPVKSNLFSYQLGIIPRTLLKAKILFFFDPVNHRKI